MTTQRIQEQYIRRAVALVMVSASMLVSISRAGTAAEIAAMPTISPGTSFTDSPPEGWSNIVLFVEGRLGAGDFEDVSSRVKRYSKMFNLVILADVGKDAQGVHRLQKTGVGFTTKIKDRNTVITLATEEDLGAELGFIARSVFEANEESLNDIKRIARSKNHVIFDAPTMMLYKGEHELMTVRYLVWVSTKTGRLNTFVWLMDNPESDRAYKLMEPAIQMLPENMKEDRVMNVKGDRFTFGIPAKDAFALVRIPQGKAIPYTPRLEKVAGLRNYDRDSLTELLKAITEAVESAATRREL
jgi:hypothetical protein